MRSRFRCAYVSAGLGSHPVACRSGTGRPRPLRRVPSAATSVSKGSVVVCIDEIDDDDVVVAVVAIASDAKRNYDIESNGKAHDDDDHHHHRNDEDKASLSATGQGSAEESAGTSARTAG